MIVTKKDIDDQNAGLYPAQVPQVVKAPSAILVWSYVVYLIGWYGLLAATTAYMLSNHADMLFWVWLIGGGYLLNDRTIQPHEWRRLWTGETPDEDEDED